MTGITHKQAMQLINRRLDGLLSDSQRLTLNEHLETCDSCRAHAMAMDGLSAHLQNRFHARWDRQPGFPQNIMEFVTTRARRRTLLNRLSSAVTVTASVGMLILLALIINVVASQLQDTSTGAVVTEATSSLPSPENVSAENRLLAFASDQTGNSDIYTVHPDGSGMTNLTNHPAHDSNPVWSPDGKRIAFESDRDGFRQIYLMNADGSDVIQLTHDQSDHYLPMNIHGSSNPWSPDGNSLLFLQQAPGAETSTLYSLDMNNGNVVMLASGSVQFNNLAWSPDGQFVGYVLNDSPTPDATFVTGIYVVDSAGKTRMAINGLLPQTDSVYSPFYYWSRDGGSVIFIAHRHLDEGKDQWIAYEAVVTGQQLIERATSSTIMDDWWEGTSFIHGMDLYTLTWLRSDGTFNTFKPLEICDLTIEASYGFLARRSPNGSQVFNVYCPDKEMWFYYASADGTVIKRLMDSPIPSITPDNSVTSLTWSSDDRFIAATQVSPTKSSLYILNVENPSNQPVEIVTSDGEFYTIPSWRPAP